MTSRYNLQFVKTFLYILSQHGVRESMNEYRTALMKLSNSFTENDFKDDFDVDKTVKTAYDNALEYKQLAGTMQEEYDKQKAASGDRVNHPSHYTWLKELCGVEVIDITRHMDFDLGNAIKYILRQGKKSEEGLSDNAKAVEDLEKAVFYINDKIKMLKKDGTK